MAISIRNARVEELAQEASRRSGLTMTDDIGEALESSLRPSGRKSEALKSRLLKLCADCASLPDLDARPADAILGYDEEGSFSSGR